jgi:hypothetical protein
MASEVDTLVKKILPTLEGKVQLDSTLISGLCSAIRTNLGAEQKELALQVLRAVVAKWQQGKGVVSPSFEVEATFELAIAAAFAGNKAAVVANVEAVTISCWDHFLSVVCRQAAAEIPKVVQKIDAAVEKAAVPSEVKAVVETVVDSVANTVEAEVNTVVETAVAGEAAENSAVDDALKGAAVVVEDLSGANLSGATAAAAVAAVPEVVSEVVAAPVAAAVPVEKAVENKKKRKVQA